MAKRRTVNYKALELILSKAIEASLEQGYRLITGGYFDTSDSLTATGCCVLGALVIQFYNDTNKPPLFNHIMRDTVTPWLTRSIPRRVQLGIICGFEDCDGCESALPKAIVLGRRLRKKYYDASA